MRYFAKINAEFYKRSAHVREQTRSAAERRRPKLCLKSLSSRSKRAVFELFLVFVIVVEVLGVLNVVGGIWSDGIVVRSAVEVITTVRVSSIFLDDLLADAQHGGEENTVRLEPVHVDVPGHSGAEERSEVIVSIDDAEKTIRSLSLPAEIIVSVANLEPSQPSPGDGLVLGSRRITYILSGQQLPRGEH